MMIKKIFNYYWLRTKPYQLYLWLILLFVIISVTASTVILPFVFANMVDQITQSSSVIGWSLGTLLTAYILCEIIGFVGWRGVEYLMISVQTKVMKKIEEDTQQDIIQYDYEFFSNRFPGSLVTTNKRFVRAYEMIVDKIFFNFLPIIISTVSIIYVLFAYAPSIFAWSLIGFCCVYIVITWRLAEWKVLADVESAAEDSRMTGLLADILSNVVTIKAFVGNRYESRRFERNNQIRFRARLRSWMRGFWQGNVLAILDRAIRVGVIVIGIYYWEIGLISAGILVLLFSYGRNITEQLRSLSRVMRDLYTAYADAREMMELFSIKPMILDPTLPAVCKIENGNILFDQVSFKYPNGLGEVFENLNLEISAGQKVAFVGTSGSGKTTVTRLLQRFYDVQDGAICIDGQDIRSITQRDLRSHISYIPQDTALFHRTIRDNIAYGMNMTDEEIIRVAKLACAHEFISNLPKGYDTLVGERGIKLSGGQRQRVAIARGFAHSTSILILDEATSSLDSESDMKVQEALSNLLKQHQPTAIVIAHRLSTIMQVDMVYVFEQGKIIQQGTPSQLMDAPGKFQELWEAQKLDYAL